MVMGRNSGAQASHHLNARLFAVVGPSYVFDKEQEFSAETGSALYQAPRGGARRWLVLGALALAIVTIANIGTIVEAATRKAHVAPFSQLAGGATSFSFTGGTEAARW
jgi:hypothetical protein